MMAEIAHRPSWRRIGFGPARQLEAVHRSGKERAPQEFLRRRKRMWPEPPILPFVEPACFDAVTPPRLAGPAAHARCPSGKRTGCWSRTAAWRPSS